MSDAAAEINAVLERETPALFQALSPLGRRAVFPPDIPFQAAQARGKAFNATIGQITDGRGGAVRLPSLVSGLTALPSRDLDRALLYSPVEGIEEVRRRWREWQRRELRREEERQAPSSLPLVTVGLTHGLSLIADLFAGAPGGRPRAVAVAEPFWGNYRQAFATRTGAEMVTAPAFRDGRFEPAALAAALASLPPAEPAVAILNFPSNPGGYSPTRKERRRLVSSLVDVAAGRPLVAVCDDAYAGLVYEEGIPRRSMFWELVGAHPNLVPVKVDGATKEVSFFGGRVGFLTFACEPGSAAARALESKVKLLVRSTLGSPVATSQVLLLQALRDDRMGAQVEELRQLLAGRVRILKEALAGVDAEILRPLPFNSGCFALVEIPEALGVAAEAARRHLLETEDTGVVAIAPRYLRVAHCSVAAEAIPELVRRLARGVAALAGK